MPLFYPGMRLGMSQRAEYRTYSRSREEYTAVIASLCTLPRYLPSSHRLVMYYPGTLLGVIASLYALLPGTLVGDITRR